MRRIILPDWHRDSHCRKRVTRRDTVNHRRRKVPVQKGTLSHSSLYQYKCCDILLVYTRTTKHVASHHPEAFFVEMMLQQTICDIVMRILPRKYAELFFLWHHFSITDFWKSLLSLFTAPSPSLLSFWGAQKYPLPEALRGFPQLNEDIRKKRPRFLKRIM